MRKNTLQTLAQVALLIAMEIIFTRFLSINTPLLRIGFGFLPIAIVGIMHGPLWAGAAAGIADLIGVFMAGSAAFFPGFTLTAVLTGVIYGLLLYHNNSWPRILIAVGIITLVLNLGMDSLWLSIMYPNAILGMMPMRILKCVIMAPIQIVLIRFTATRLPIVSRVASRAKSVPENCNTNIR